MLPGIRGYLGPDDGQVCVDNQRFAQYIASEIPSLNRLARQLVPDCDADDLVQETLLRAYQAIDRFDGRHPRAWVRTIMRNAWKNMLRDRARMQISPTEDQILTRHQPICADPERGSIHDILEPGLADALAALPAPQYAALSLVDLDGFSYQQTADLLNIPFGTVLSRVHRGRQRMRDQLIAITMAAAAQSRPGSNQSAVTTSGDTAELARSCSLYRTMIRHEPVIAFSVDKDGIILSREGKGLALLGQSSGAGVGQHFADFHRAAPAVLANAERAHDVKCGTARLELCGTSWDAYQSAIRDLNGQVAGVVGMVVLR